MVKVRTLGSFQMSYDGVSVEDSDIRSTMMTKLLMYMLIYRKKDVSSAEICSALWQEDDTDNPTGALKNLMYRLRNFLKKHFGISDFIITKRGSYSWNPGYEVEFDASVFEKKITKASKEENMSEAVELYNEALDLYNGDFMPKITDMHWILTLNTYYHSLYLSAVKELSALYKEIGAYEKIEKICNKALKIDRLDEQIYCFLLDSMYNQGKNALAVESYNKAKEILEKELGVFETEDLDQIYADVLNATAEHEIEGMEIIYDDMAFCNDDMDGAFVCGYQVFKQIYRLEARKNARDNKEGQLLLVTLDCGGSGLQDKVAEYRLGQAMKALQQILIESLRLGDVTAKYSKSQFIVLLQDCNYSNGVMVSNRIISNLLEKNDKYKSISVQIDIEPIELAGNGEHLFEK